MSTKTPADEIFVHDQIPQLHPIRLPARGLLELHERTEMSLNAFLMEHVERFPQRVGQAVWSR